MRTSDACCLVGPIRPPVCVCYYRVNPAVHTEGEVCLYVPGHDNLESNGACLRFSWHPHLNRRLIFYFQLLALARADGLASHKPTRTPSSGGYTIDAEAAFVGAKYATPPPPRPPPHTICEYLVLDLRRGSEGGTRAPGGRHHPDSASYNTVAWGLGRKLSHLASSVLALPVLRNANATLTYLLPLCLRVEVERHRYRTISIYIYRPWWFVCSPPLHIIQRLTPAFRVRSHCTIPPSWPRVGSYNNGFICTTASASVLNRR